MAFLPVSGKSLRVSARVLLFPVARPKGPQIATDGIAVFILVKSRHGRGMIIMRHCIMATGYRYMSYCILIDWRQVSSFDNVL